MNEYRCLLLLDVRFEDGERERWERRITLPFVPWKGLTLSGVSETDDYYVDMVVWDHADKEFSLTEELDTALNRADDVARELGPGWERCPE